MVWRNIPIDCPECGSEPTICVCCTEWTVQCRFCPDMVATGATRDEAINNWDELAEDD